MKKTLLMSAFAMAGMTSAHAVDIKAGDWTVSVGGIINAYYTSVSCKGAPTAATADGAAANAIIGGAPLAGAGLGCGGKSDATTIGNGLLPNGLIVSAKSTQNGIDIGATMGIYSAISSNSAIANNSNVDVRQGFMTLGTKEVGTFKLGRDYGIFGSNAILNDMTLLGVGAPTNATQQNRVTLGHIGAGYTYLGNYAQMTYSSPSMSGFKFDGGVFSPVDSAAVNNKDSKAPQYQYQVSYVAGGFKGWLGGKNQDFEATTGETATAAFKTSATEIGASYNMGNLGLLANFQEGKGLGILSDGDQGGVKGQNSFGQITYKVMPKVKLGLNYGKSENKDATGANFKSNENTTAGVYYNLTPSVTLVGELSKTDSKAANGNKATQDGVSFGAIMFF
ncbi:MAG: porin [Burkholderiales bacterium]|jgi:predicted porin|nr:porin [Burkholderiales bacterium]